MRIIISACLAISVAGCASQSIRYVKPGVDRHTVAIDRLECQKQAVMAHRSVLARSSALDNTARLRANAAARKAVERCAVSHGYRRVQ